MIKEIWKDIPNCEGYQVSNLGNVRHIKITQLKAEKRFIKNTKYRQARVTINNKKYAVHRLVAEAFIPNEQKKIYVNHKDGNSLNNFVKNLEWCTPKENVRHAIENNLRKTKIPLKDYKKICNEYEKGKTMSEIAKKYDVHDTSIRTILLKNNIKIRTRGKYERRKR